MKRYRKFPGTESQYTVLHAWIRKQLGTPQQCENCGTTDAARFEWANVDGLYQKKIEGWKRLCPPCHRYMDRGINYWYDEFCLHGHRLTVNNLYLKHTKLSLAGRCLECRQCREVSRAKYESKKRLELVT